jgi:hypothetical protein
MAFIYVNWNNSFIIELHEITKLKSLGSLSGIAMNSFNLERQQSMVGSFLQEIYKAFYYFFLLY